MTHTLWLLTAWALLLSLLSANADADSVCAPPVEYQVLAADDRNGTGGIGGTGYSADPGDGGIGGTGHGLDEGGMGGTGIVGTITGFASICVNGLEVHYDDSVPVSENGKATTARGLAIGQVVAVNAARSARGLEARKIEVINALEGPVTRIADHRQRIEVMGASVELPASSMREQAASLKVGDWVQVSGHPGADGSILASRVAAIEARAEASVSGDGSAQQRRIGNVSVDQAENGPRTVRGRWTGSRIEVRDSQPQAGRDWSGTTRRVVIESRITDREGNRARTGRSELDAALATQNAASALPAGTLIRVSARIDRQGKLHEARIERASRDRRDENGRDKSEKSATPDQDRAERDARENRKQQEKSGRELDKAQRAERDQREGRSERNERNDRTERNERPDRIERPDRSGRDH